MFLRLFVVESHGPKIHQAIAAFRHLVNVLLVPSRGLNCAKLAIRVDQHCGTASHVHPADARDECASLIGWIANSNYIGIAACPLIANLDVLGTSRDVVASVVTKGYVGVRCAMKSASYPTAT